MLFNSIEYLFFLPLVFLIYWVIGYAKVKDSLKLRLQNAFVVIASYVFYGWWDWRFLILIAFTSFCSWGSGLLIAKHHTSNIIHNTSQKFWLWLNIAMYRAEIDAIATNNPHIYTIEDELNEEFHGFYDDTWLYKLTYKKSFISEIQGKPTYYQVIGNSSNIID